MTTANQGNYPHRVNGKFYDGYWRHKNVEHVAEVIAAKPKPLFGIRRDQAHIVKIIGERLREARELCNLSQIESSRRLGYLNSSKLCKLESASSGNSVPHWVLDRAATVYQVSLDFLYGRTDEWERDISVVQERNIANYIQDIWEKTRLSETNTIRILINEIKILSNAVREYEAVVLRQRLKYESFLKANPKFLDMEKSNNIPSSISEAEMVVHNQRALLKRFVRSCQVNGDVGGVILKQSTIFDFGT